MSEILLYLLTFTFKQLDDELFQKAVLKNIICTEGVKEKLLPEMKSNFERIQAKYSKKKPKKNEDHLEILTAHKLSLIAVTMQKIECGEPK